MPQTSTHAVRALLDPFDATWRDDTPVFACCRKAVAAAVEGVDVCDVATRGATDRVQALREVLDEQMPGHLAAHRCCAGHLADLAFDMPDVLAPVDAS